MLHRATACGRHAALLQVQNSWADGKPHGHPCHHGRSQMASSGIYYKGRVIWAHAVRITSPSALLKSPPGSLGTVAPSFNGS
jgi:hypothetical protein